MAWKNLKQKSFADVTIVEHRALQELDSLNELVDWLAIEALLGGVHAKTRGEKAWSPLIRMFHKRMRYPG